MSKTKTIVMILVILSIVLLGACVDSDNNTTVDEEYKAEVKFYLQKYADRIKSESDLSELGVKTIDSALINALDAIDKSNKYTTIEKYDEAARKKIRNAEIKLNYNAKISFQASKNSGEIKENFIDENRTYGIGYEDGIDYTLPSYRAFIYEDQKSFDEILIEPFSVDFENKMVIVILSTQTANTDYYYRKVSIENNVLKIIKRYQKTSINNSSAPFYYLMIDVMTIDKLNVQSVEIDIGNIY